MDDYAPERVGIYRYARPERWWEFRNARQTEQRRSWDALRQQFDRRGRERPHGMICRSWRMARQCSLWPVVCLHGSRRRDGVSQAAVDDVAVGELAAEHLMGLGLESFAFIGIRVYDLAFPGRWYGFARRLRREGFAPARFHWYGRYPRVRRRLPFGTIFREEVHRWVAQLPKPVGVYCEDDLRGVWVCEACRHLGLPVPEAVAVLGTGDNDVDCNESWPPLSSIRLPDEQVGYEAAGLLDRLIRGDARPGESVLLPPKGVAMRPSTDTIATDDADVAAALAYIRRHACEGMRVEDVLDQVSVSRRVLENRFRRRLGRTPFQEIRRLQVQRVKEWLVDTDASIERIAHRTGFAGRTRLSEAFRKATGMSPGAYRMQFRIR